MKRLVLPAMMAPLLWATPVLAQSQNWLLGAWTLVSATNTENGQTRDYFGSHPLGTIVLTADGHFADMLIRSDLPKFQTRNRSTGTAAENAAVVKGSIAIYGDYSLAGDTLKLHIVGSTFPNWNGTDQTRIVHLTGNEFTWQNAAASVGGSDKLVFRRAK